MTSTVYCLARLLVARLFVARLCGFNKQLKIKREPLGSDWELEVGENYFFHND